jgi:hypothetical protein
MCNFKAPEGAPKNFFELVTEKEEKRLSLKSTGVKMSD